MIWILGPVSVLAVVLIAVAVCVPTGKPRVQAAGGEPRG